MTDTELSPPTIVSRHAQAFPLLPPEAIEHLVRFGTRCEYANGDRVYETGRPSPGLFVVLSGALRITRRDGHGHDVMIVEMGPGVREVG